MILQSMFFKEIPFEKYHFGELEKIDKKCKKRYTESVHFFHGTKIEMKKTTQEKER